MVGDHMFIRSVVVPVDDHPGAYFVVRFHEHRITSVSVDYTVWSNGEYPDDLSIMGKGAFISADAVQKAVLKAIEKLEAEKEEAKKALEAGGYAQDEGNDVADNSVDHDIKAFFAGKARDYSKR